jgi:hypothetical protein
MQYRCTHCGGTGTKDQLRRHICNGTEKVYHDDTSLLTTLVCLNMMSEMTGGCFSPISPSSEPDFVSGGGNSGGGGASGSYDSSNSSDSSCGSFDSGSSCDSSSY